MARHDEKAYRKEAFGYAALFAILMVLALLLFGPGIIFYGAVFLFICCVWYLVTLKTKVKKWNSIEGGNLVSTSSAQREVVDTPVPLKIFDFYELDSEMQYGCYLEYKGSVFFIELLEDDKLSLRKRSVEYLFDSMESVFCDLFDYVISSLDDEYKHIKKDDLKLCSMGLFNKDDPSMFEIYISSRNQSYNFSLVMRNGCFSDFSY